jgi:hypothetical protein
MVRQEGGRGLGWFPDAASELGAKRKQAVSNLLYALAVGRNLYV